MSEWLPLFRTRLYRLHTDAAEGPYVICFTFSAANESYIQGSCYALKSDTEEVRRDKKRRANALPMLAALRALSDRDFKFLCGLVLKKFGVAEPNVTRGSGDQGLDFYGQAPFGSLIAKTTLPNTVEQAIRVWIIGQAKRYIKTKVTTAALRELVGSVELSRSGVHASPEDPLKNLNVRLCDPIFYMMITSGEFTRGSAALISRSGVIGMDGLQLCLFLADHGLGGGEAGFDAAVLASEIDEIKNVVNVLTPSPANS